ncbi:MAG: caspase family protein [Nonlabens sp.]|uniref:caspase family protein n=1 Tax=Nonlabens sp. TaxID=1888209 RepID=UPI003EFA2CD9
MRNIITIICVLSFCIAFSQDTSFRVNLGLNEIQLSDSHSTDFNDFIDAPFNDDHTYAFAKNDELITIWDLKHKVVVKNITVNDEVKQYADDFPTRVISKAYFVSGKNEIYYTISLFNEEAQKEKFFIIFYDYKTDKITKKIILNNNYRDVLYGCSEHLILVQGGEFTYDLEIFNYQFSDESISSIRHHTSDNGMNFLRWQRINNELYYAIVADQKIGVFDVKNNFEFDNVSFPDGYDLETNYVTGVALSYDLKHAVVVHSNNSFVTRLEDNKIIYDQIPTQIGNNLPIEIFFNKDGTRFIYEQYESGVAYKENKTLSLLEFNIANGKSRKVDVIKNSREAKIDFLNFNPKINKDYEVKGLLKFMDFKNYYSSYRIENKLMKIHKNEWITAFSNGILTFYDAKTGSFEVFDEVKLQNCQSESWLRPSECQVSGMEFFNDHVIVAFHTGNVVELVTINLKSKKVINNTIIDQVKKVENFKINLDENKILISLTIGNNKNENQELGKTAIFDLKKFEIDYLDLFENRFYDFLYETNNNRWIAGYLSDLNQTFIYDKISLKLLRTETGLLFINDDQDYVWNIEIEKETQLEQVENPDCNYDNPTYPDCDFIIEKEVIYTKTTGTIHLDSASSKRKLKTNKAITEFIYKELTTGVDQLTIGTQDNLVHFKSNGRTIFEFNISTLESLEYEDLIEFKGYPVQGTNNQPVLVKNFGFNNVGNRIDADGEIIKNENHIDLYYSEPEKEDGYRFLNGDYINRPFQLVHVDSTHIGLVNGGLPSENYYTSWSIYVHDADENGFNGYPEFEIYYNEDELQYISDDELDELDHYRSTFLTFYNIATNSEVKLRLYKNFVSKVNKFHKVGNRLFVCDKENNTTQEIILTEVESKVVNNITSISSLGNWQVENRYSHLKSEEDDNGIFKIIDKDSKTSVVDAFFNSNGSYFISTADNYYVANKEIFDYIWFQREEQIYRPEQFDLQFNRPDLVLEKIGSSTTSIIDSYQALYEKRLRKMGIKESVVLENHNIPELHLEDKFKIPSSTKSDKVKLSLTAQDSLFKISSVKIWNNNVPVLTQDYTSSKTNLKKDKVSVDLASGENKIQISVFNENGIESKKETVYIQKIAASRKPNLYLLTVGVSEFDNKAYDLKYAVKDAMDVASTLQSSTAFEKVYTQSLTNAEVTEENLLKSKSFFEKASIDDVVILFIASHGVLDKESNYYLGAPQINFDTPSQGGIDYLILEDVLASAPSLKKIILLDACHSGELDEEDDRAFKPLVTAEDVSQNKGENNNVKARGSGSTRVGKSVDNITTISKNIFTDLRLGNGINIISSAGGEEFAYEGDEWNNGLFTYTLLHGLTSGQADLNQDGKIMLSELQEYTFDEVSSLSNGLQTPTFRRQNISGDYRVW